MNTERYYTRAITPDGILNEIDRLETMLAYIDDEQSEDSLHMLREFYHEVANMGG